MPAHATEEVNVPRVAAAPTAAAATVVVAVEVVPVAAEFSVGWDIRGANGPPKRSGGQRQEIVGKRRARSDGHDGVLDVAVSSERRPEGKRKGARLGENRTNLGTRARRAQLTHTTSVLRGVLERNISYVPVPRRNCLQNELEP